MSPETTAPSKPARRTKAVPTNGASPREQLDREQLLELYRRLVYARYFDTTLYDLKRKGRIIRGEIYSSRGQEAVLVGSTYPLRDSDYISPIHRDLVAYIFKGMPAREVMAQVFCKYTAPGKSKDVWTHFGDLTRGIIHSTSMLASTVPVACGVAQALKMDNRDSVVVSYMGEGATARGDLHEGLNYAAIHKLPLIVLVENNQWAYSTPLHLGCPTPQVADRAKGFGIPGWTVDGQDVLAVYDIMVRAIDHARKGNGPSIVECVTYRVHGHASHDDTKAAEYRPKEMQEEWNSPHKDALVIFRKYLLKHGFKASDVPEEPPAQTVAEVQDAVEFAMNSPSAPADEALKDIYDESAGVSQ